MRSSPISKFVTLSEELAAQAIQEQFSANKSVYRLYDLSSLIVQIYKRNFARGQIALVDNVVRPYLEQHKSIVLNNMKDEMVSELTAIISHESFLQDYPGHSDYEDGSEYYYHQMMKSVPAMACQYATKLKNDFFLSVKKDNDLVSGWIAKNGFNLADFNDFTGVLAILTTLHEQDQKMLEACYDLEMYPALSWNLTLKLARVFCTAIDDEAKLATVLKLLPEPACQSYESMVRSCWPVPESVRQARRHFSWFADSAQNSVSNEVVQLPSMKRQ